MTRPETNGAIGAAGQGEALRSFFEQGQLAGKMPNFLRPT